MKNKLGDLNNHLFEQIERLNDDDLTGDDLVREINRAHAIAGLSQQVIANGKLALDAAKALHEFPNMKKAPMLLLE
jgi:hypothetical protein